MNMIWSEALVGGSMRISWSSFHSGGGDHNVSVTGEDKAFIRAGNWSIYISVLTSIPIPISYDGVTG